MGEYSNIQLRVIDLLAQVLADSITSKRLDCNDKDRLLYAACVNDKEKDELTVQLIKKLQKKLVKCKTHIAIYVSEILNDYERKRFNLKCGYNEWICKSYISNYSEGIVELAKNFNSIEAVEEEECYLLDYIKEDYQGYFNCKDINHFVKYMTIAERLYILKEILKDSRILNETKEFNFKSLTDEKQVYILKILEDLAITKGDIYILNSRTKGSIRGVVEALRTNNILPNLSLEKLNNAIATKINLELKSKLDWSKTSDDYKNKTLKYIEKTPFHKKI